MRYDRACGSLHIVDLEGLDFIDCGGLGVLVGVLRRVRASGGDLPLAAPQRMVRKVLTVTGLMDVFSVHPTVEQATRAQGLGRARVLADNLVTICGLQTAIMPTATAIALRSASKVEGVDGDGIDGAIRGALFQCRACRAGQTGAGPLPARGVGHGHAAGPLCCRGG